jgi:hypothetical protein
MFVRSVHRQSVLLGSMQGNLPQVFQQGTAGLPIGESVKQLLMFHTVSDVQDTRLGWRQVGVSPNV